MKKIIQHLFHLCLFSLLPLMSFAQFSCKESDKPSNTVEIPVVILNNSIEMPQLGFGTLDLHGPNGANSIAQAISLGYRLFDTATVYGNEETVGAGIQQSGIDRSELFITTKVWVEDMGYENTKKAFETSLAKLGTDYIDLYLIHRPRGDIQGTWKAMEELCESGKIRAIGVSNFEPEQLAELISHARIMPAVNQIESNPFFQQQESKKTIEEMGVQVEAWSPFAQGRKGLFTNPVLTSIGEKYGKTAAQVTLRWLMQRGVVAIPRTADREYMLENIDIFDFELDEGDMQRISGLDLNESQFPEWS